MPLPYPEGTTPREADSPQRSLVKINQLIGDLTDALEAGGGGGSTVGDTSSPEGAVTGDTVGEFYIQLNGDGDVATIWVFNGTPGTNTGWITFP